jgi:hypothetical protein
MHSFVLLTRGANLVEPENFAALARAGCDDALLGQRGGTMFAEFRRDTARFEDAVLRAIGQIEQAVPEALVIRVEPDDLVSLTEIAERTGRSKEAIRLYSEGRRGPGQFPPALAWVAQRHKLWQWSDVAAWFEEALGRHDTDNEKAQFIAALNGLLELRARAERLSSSAQRALSPLAGSQATALDRGDGAARAWWSTASVGHAAA